MTFRVAMALLPVTREDDGTTVALHPYTPLFKAGSKLVIITALRKTPLAIEFTFWTVTFEVFLSCPLGPVQTVLTDSPPFTLVRRVTVQKRVTIPSLTKRCALTDTSTLGGGTTERNCL